MHDAYEKKLASKKSSSGRGGGERPERTDRADRSDRGGREKKKRDKGEDDGPKPDKKSSTTSRREGEKREDERGEGSTTKKRRGERRGGKKGESNVTGEAGQEDTADSATKAPIRILKKVFIYTYNHRIS